MADNNEVETLLKAYLNDGSEDAFLDLVEKYRGLVFSSALRQLNGDRQLAEDAMQKVFTDLARKAAKLSADGSLGGWLHCHTCFVCSDLRRSEQRRRDREHAVSEETIARYTCSAPAYLSNAITRSNLLRGEHVFVMREGLSLAVQVLNEEGEPLANVWGTRHEAITADYIFHGGSTRPRRTGEVGKFLFTPLLARRNVLSFEKTGYTRQRVLVDVNSNSPPLQIVIERGGTVQIGLTDAAGNPIPGASLRSAERPHPQQDWFYSSETPAIVPGGWLYGQSGISGIVVFTNVPSVPVTLRSRKFGFEPVTFVLSNDVDSAEIALERSQ